MRDFSYRITATDATGPGVNAAVRSFDRLNSSATGTSRAVESGFTRTSGAINKFTSFLGQQAVGAVRSFFYGLRMGIVGAGVAVAGFVASSISAFQDFDKKLRETTSLIAGGSVSSGSGDLASRMAAARKEAQGFYTDYKAALQAMSAGLRTTPQNLGGGLYEITSAGITKSRQALNLLNVSAKGAAAGSTYASSIDSGTSAKSLIGVLNALKIGGGASTASKSQMQQVMDKLFQTVNLGVGIEYGPLAKMMSQSIGTVGGITGSKNSSQTLNQMLGAFILGSQKTLTSGQLGVGYMNMVQKLANPSGAAISAAQGFGIDLSGANGAVMIQKLGVMGALGKIRDALIRHGAKPGSPEYTHDINEIWRDVRGERVVDMLMNNMGGLGQTGDYGQYSTVVGNSRGSTQAAFTEQGKSLNAKINTFKALWANLQIALGGSLSSPFSSGMGWLTKMMGNASGGSLGAKEYFNFVNTNLNRRQRHQTPISAGAFASTLTPEQEKAFDQYNLFSHAGSAKQFETIGKTLFLGIKAYWDKPSTQQDLQDMFTNAFDLAFQGLTKTIINLPSIVDFGRQLVVQVLKGVQAGLANIPSSLLGSGGSGIMNMNLGGSGGGMNMLASLLMAGTLFKGTRGAGALKGGVGAAGAAAIMGVPLPIALAMGALSGKGGIGGMLGVGKGGASSGGGLDNYSIRANNVYVSGGIAGGGVGGGAAGRQKYAPGVEDFVSKYGDPTAPSNIQTGMNYYGGGPQAGHTYNSGVFSTASPYGGFMYNSGAYTDRMAPGYYRDKAGKLRGPGGKFASAIPVMGGEPSQAELAAARARRTGPKISGFQAGAPNYNDAAEADMVVQRESYLKRLAATYKTASSRLGSLKGTGMGGAGAAGGLGLIMGLMSGQGMSGALGNAALFGGSQLVMGGGLGRLAALLPELGLGTMLGASGVGAAAYLLMNPDTTGTNKNASQVGKGIGSSLLYHHQSAANIATLMHGASIGDNSNKGAGAAFRKMAISQINNSSKILDKLSRLPAGTKASDTEAASLVAALINASNSNPIVMSAGAQIYSHIHAAYVAAQAEKVDLIWESKNGGQVSPEAITTATKGMGKGGKQSFITTLAGNMAANSGAHGAYMANIIRGYTKQLGGNVPDLGGPSQSVSDAVFKAIFTPTNTTMDYLKKAGAIGPDNFTKGFGSELVKQKPNLTNAINTYVNGAAQIFKNSIGGGSGGGAGGTPITGKGSRGGQAKTINTGHAHGISSHDPFGELGANLANSFVNQTVAGVGGQVANNITGRAMKGLAWLERQVGKPYVWGAGHPVNPNLNAYDCSGLVSAALQVMGYKLNGTTMSMIGGTNPGVNSPIEIGFNSATDPSHMGIGIMGKWFEAKGKNYGILGPGQARTQWAYEGTPKFHKGGQFRTRTAGGEGHALLKDGEMVVRRGGDGGLTAHPVSLGGGGCSVIINIDKMEVRSAQDIEQVASKLVDLLNSKMINSGRTK